VYVYVYVYVYRIWGWTALLDVGGP
jgi:hypothetical protein